MKVNFFFFTLFVSTSSLLNAQDETFVRNGVTYNRWGEVIALDSTSSNLTLSIVDYYSKEPITPKSVGRYEVFTNSEWNSTCICGLYAEEWDGLELAAQIEKGLKVFATYDNCEAYCRGAELQNNIFTDNSSIIRDPNGDKEFANLNYRAQYTLFDLYTDQPILHDGAGNYKIYCVQSKSSTKVFEVSGTALQLSNTKMYKFSSVEHARSWISQFIVSESPNSQQNINLSGMYSSTSNTDWVMLRNNGTGTLYITSKMAPIGSKSFEWEFNYDKISILYTNSIGAEEMKFFWVEDNGTNVKLIMPTMMNDIVFLKTY